MKDEKNMIKQAEEILRKYKEGKKALEKKVIQHEEWYKLRHWETLRAEGTHTSSAWLFNSLANKHADAMDNFPQPVFLPREAGDKEDADALSKIVPVILEQNDFEAAYHTAWWDKLKTGTGIYKVFWDGEKENGLGDIGIIPVDILSVFWEPGVKDIQDSENFFHTELVSKKYLKEQYPNMEFSEGAYTETAKYTHDDTIDTTEKALVVDWYYKVQQEEKGGSPILHYMKFCDGNVLFSSEEAEGMEGGFYAHGLYPYVFDVLFPEKDSPVGFGYIDIMKDAQISIDNIWTAFEENVIWNAKPRYFQKQGMGINEKQFADITCPIVDYTGNADDLHPIPTKPIGGIATGLYQMKIEELKETSNNRDFSQGSTASGVTAASAIAALQEAGSKTSRDMIKASYRAFVQINRLVLELIRQFYDMPREFRITGKAGEEFTTYDNSGINPKEEGRKPIFDIKISSQKSSPFSRMAQNELAKELYGAGLFNPELADQAALCVGMMDFEGKEEILKKIEENGSLLQTIQEMQGQIVEMAGVIQELTGRDMIGAVTEGQGGSMKGGMPPKAEEQKDRGSGIVERARQGTAERTAVQ